MRFIGAEQQGFQPLFVAEAERPVNVIPRADTEGGSSGPVQNADESVEHRVGRGTWDLGSRFSVEGSLAGKATRGQ